MRKPIVIGVAGGSASGKTLFTRKLIESLETKKSVVVIRQDDYYKDQKELTFEERLKVNYDHPLAFDNHYLVEQLTELIAGKKIEKPVYDFTTYTRSEKTITIYSSEIIILEGLFVLEESLIRDFLDIKIYVDTDADIRLIRRLLRDVKERGRTIESVIYQYLETVREMHLQFVEPSKRYADIIVPSSKENAVAIDLVATKMSSIIRNNVI